MNIIQSDPRLPIAGSIEQGRLVTRLYEVLRGIANAVNGSYMWDSQGTAAPTTGTWFQGQMVKNTAPSEAGTAGSKYLVIGWCCSASGSPGTWLPMRVLTGN